MNEWSAHRKRIVFLIVLAFLIVLVGVPLAYFVYEAPACSDKKRNGDETGVDCGGSCTLLCAPESLPLISRGDPRIIELANGAYAVVLVVENPNISGEIYRAGYGINLYGGTTTRVIKTILGEAHVPRNSTFVIFEGPVLLETRPTRATLEWLEPTLVWTKEVKPIPNLVLKEEVLADVQTTPRLTAKLENLSLDDVSSIEFIALIYDRGGNVIAASKTFIEKVRRGESADLIFSWLKPFSEEIVTFKIFPHILPDASFIR